MRILIAEDDFTSRRLIQKYLTPYGLCEVAVNGREAIDAFSSAWEERQPYNLLFLDLMMPEMSGQEVLKRIRQMETGRNIQEQNRAKIIITTARNDSASVLEAIQSKCNAYLLKPVEKKELLKKMSKLGFG